MKLIEKLKQLLQGPTPTKETYVMITQKGKKFHYDPDCSALRGAKTTGIKLSEARRSGYTACDKCNI